MEAGGRLPNRTNSEPSIGSTGWVSVLTNATSAAEIVNLAAITAVAADNGQAAAAERVVAARVTV